MKIIKLLNDLQRKPLSLMPTYFDTLLQTVKEGAFLEIDARMLEDGAIYKEVGNSAIINVQGVLLPKATKLEKMLGAVSYSDIRKAVKQAEASSVSNVIFSIDSPGGLVQGVEETGSAIKRLSGVKDTYAYTGGNMASAAYWLASQTSSIIASQSSIIGSVGVYVAWLSYGRALENEGVQANIFQAGSLKTLGLPAKDPTEEEKAYIQGQVEKNYQSFLAAISHRKLDPSVTQGQVFMGTEALEVGLVDGLQTDLEELVSFLNSNF